VIEGEDLDVTSDRPFVTSDEFRSVIDLDRARGQLIVGASLGGLAQNVP